MKKCIYITDDGWWDTDVTILPQIVDDYDITVVVSERKNQLKYENKDISGISDIVTYQTQYRNNDLRKFIQSFSFALKNYKKLFRKQQVPLILYLKNSDIVLTFLSTLFLNKKRTIVGIHDYKIHKGKSSKCYEFLYNMMYHRFHYFLFFSESQYAAFLSTYPKKKAFYINMPLKNFGVITKEKHECRKRVFLFFGFIQEYKRLDLFIKAAQKADSTATFIIAGACNDWSQYETMLTGNENIQCDIHFLSKEEIRSYFQKADYLVLPYDEATQSGPLTIAYNYCLPVIATDIDIFKKMVSNGKNGFLFPKGNLQAFIQTINQANNISNEEYESLTENMHKRREEYQKTTNFKVALKEFLEENNI